MSGALRCTDIERADAPGAPAPADAIVLAHDARRLRRRRLVARGGTEVLLDLPRTLSLRHGDRLVLEDGRRIGVIAADEDLTEVRGADARHLAVLAWQIGNRHLAARIEEGRILILRDPVISEMLEGLGAALRELRAPFEPEGGAYGDGHAHDHGHGHHHDHGHDHHHG